MRKSLILFLLLATAGWASVTKPRYQPATVVSVENHETPSNYVGDNPTDAPLQAEAYAYDIGLRLDCTVYSLRYQSAIDYLPSVFTPEHELNVYAQKHFMYVDVPGRGDMRLEITGHRRLKDSSCMAHN